MVTYSLSDIPPDVWESFKEQVPRTRNLEGAIVERLAAQDVGDRTADGQGRVHIGPEHAGSDVQVFVLPVDD